MDRLRGGTKEGAIKVGYLESLGSDAGTYLTTSSQPSFERPVRVIILQDRGFLSVYVLAVLHVVLTGCVMGDVL